MVRYSILFILQYILFTGCNTSTEGREAGTVIIEISKAGEYIVNGKNVLKEDLQNYLLSEIEEVEKSGYQRTEITADIRTHPEAKMGKVSYLQMALRNLKIRKVLYSNTPSNTPLKNSKN